MNEAIVEGIFADGNSQDEFLFSMYCGKHLMDHLLEAGQTELVQRFLADVHYLKSCLQKAGITKHRELRHSLSGKPGRQTPISIHIKYIVGLYPKFLVAQALFWALK